MKVSLKEIFEQKGLVSLIGQIVILKVGVSCVRADIPSNLLAFEDKPIESLFIELNLQNTKILINCSYNPHKSMVFHLRHYTHIKDKLKHFWCFHFEMEFRFQNRTFILKWNSDFKMEFRFRSRAQISKSNFDFKWSYQSQEGL